jgi:hypothetical protein
LLLRCHSAVALLLLPLLLPPLLLPPLLLPPLLLPLLLLLPPSAPLLRIAHGPSAPGPGPCPARSLAVGLLDFVVLGIPCYPQ